MNPGERINEHTTIPARPDLIRLGLGIIGIGTSLALHFIGFFLAMRMTTVAAGTALVALQPIFAALFVKFSGGHIPSKAWLGMIVSFVGVVLVSGVDLTISFRSFMGDIAALISAALAAAYMMAGSKAQRTLETSTYTTVCYFICSMTALCSGSLVARSNSTSWNHSWNCVNSDRLRLSSY